MWYFPLLRPFVDHVPVKSDLSDLRQKIEWCRSHDAECEKIASNAKKLYARFIGREGVIIYMGDYAEELSFPLLFLFKYYYFYYCC